MTILVPVLGGASASVIEGLHVVVPCRLRMRTACHALRIKLMLVLLLSRRCWKDGTQRPPRTAY